MSSRPSWPPITTILPRDDAIASHSEKLFRDEVIIYTYAGRTDDGIGTAAVALFSGIIRATYVGKLKDYRYSIN